MKTLGIGVLSLLALVGVLALIPDGQATLSQLIAMALPRNTNPPAYLKEVVAYKEGDGLVVYLTLADAAGAYTSADGSLYVAIRDESSTVWDMAYTIRQDEFRTEQVGRGPFARTILLLSLGRISDKAFFAPRRSTGLTVEVTFTTGGQRLTGSQRLWL